MYLFPQLIVAVIAVASCVQDVTCTVPDQEVDALLAFYESAGGDNWKWRTGPLWNFTRDTNGELIDNPCSTSVSVAFGNATTWEGITCSSSPQLCSKEMCNVIGITLADYGLMGTLPDDIEHLAHLKNLNLFSNHLSGTIPSQLGNLSALTYLDLWSNLLSGPIPKDIGNNLALQFLYLIDNTLSGRIPSEVTNLVGLRRLYLSANLLTGSILSNIGGFPHMERLYLDSNALTGSIPPDIGELTLLHRLYLSTNSLSGPIPAEIGNLIRLTLLYLQYNSLTGSIPREVGNLTVLKSANLHDNLLSALIPSEIGNLAVLDVLDCETNLLTGPIPLEVTKLHNLRFFSIHHNAITGTIPTELGSMTRLTLLDVASNLLTGPIPTEVGSLILLSVLGLDHNSFSRPLPSELGNLVALTFLRLNDNLLTGPVPRAISNLVKLILAFFSVNKLTGSVDNVFNSSSQVTLEVIDMSDNQLSGHNVGSLYRLPSLKVLALSGNCFKSELSESICAAESVEVFSLNGLGASDNCASTFKLPLSGVSLFNTIDGTVPACVWSLRNLTVLHLTGNGLTGEIVSQLPSYSKISDLSLSHNQLRGTIPLDIFRVKTLDLSYNLLSGVFAEDIHYVINSSVNLQVNRLSGHLPVAVLESGNVSSLNILVGNLFSCASIPGNDDYATDYICGSENFNVATYVFFCILGIYLLLLMMLSFVNSSFCASLKSTVVLYLRREISRLWMYRTYVDTVLCRSLPEAIHLQKIAAISDNFKKIIALFVVLLVAVLVTSVPIYSLRLSDTSDIYSTHYYTYTWFWTVAYMRGDLPASFILGSWMTILAVSLYLMIIREAGPEKSGVAGAQSLSKNGVNRFAILVIKIASAFTFNAIVAISVNVLYIYTTQQALSPSRQLAIQLSMAVFRLIYSAVFIPILSQSFADTTANIDFRLRLLITNNLTFPCIATALTSPSCFQELLFPAEAVSTPYEFEFCSLSNSVECTAYSTREDYSAPIISPFAYKNQCASVHSCFNIWIFNPAFVYRSFSYCSY